MGVRIKIAEMSRSKGQWKQKRTSVKITLLLTSRKEQQMTYSRTPEKTDRQNLQSVKDEIMPLK